MEKAYWLGRKRAAKAMARAATCSEARLIHYELAGRYSLKAAFTPFMLPVKGPATEGERDVLRLPIIPRQFPFPRGHQAGDGK
jgi:hypothetical protein